MLSHTLNSLCVILTAEEGQSPTPNTHILEGLGFILHAYILPMQAWSDEMLGSEEEFKSWEKYGIKSLDAVAGKKEDRSADPVGGISGTFKKLNCD